MDETTLNELIAIHHRERALTWWEGEHPFQIIVETIATQQCRLIEGSMWAYELKLLADQSTGGNMLEEVVQELEKWLLKNNTTWGKEAETARNTQDWNSRQCDLIKNSTNKIASIATRSLWAWYGRYFAFHRARPEFITVKPWTAQHKNWLIKTDTKKIISSMTFNIIASTRKVDGIREFVMREKLGQFENLMAENAVKILKTIRSVGDETERKIALFYFNLPFPIFDAYL